MSGTTTLTIDTRSPSVVRVAITKASGKTVTKDLELSQSQDILPLLCDLFIEEHEDISGIARLKFVAGAGSFTGLRVSAAIVNVLSWLFTIPINNASVGEYIYPSYTPSQFDQ